MPKTSEINDLETLLIKVRDSNYNIVYLTSDITKLGFVTKSGAPRLIVCQMVELIKSYLSDKTVIFPTATLNFAHTNETFNASSTPSYNMGVLNEALRRDAATFRSCHPLWSHAGFGPMAIKILDNSSKNAYGFDSIWDRIKNKDALVMNLGVDVRNSMTVVRHLEQIIGVPYRYSKIFSKNVIDYNGNLANCDYTINVVYKTSKIDRDRNEKLCDGFEPYLIQRQFSDLQTYEYDSFYQHLAEKFRNDMFSWVRNTEEVREQCLDLLH